MVPSAALTRAHAALQRHFRGPIIATEASLRECSRDFGGMVERRPEVVLRPSSTEDVRAALCIAGEAGVPISTRGAGHGQSGQGLGAGLVLDMSSLDRVLRLDSEGQYVEVEAGATWESVVRATYAQGLLPVGLTHALDTTVAGTLSVGGVGGESFRIGPQVDNVLALQVATMSGQIVDTGVGENEELFDAVRASVGQCGVILRARYPVRPCAATIRTRTFAYTDAQRFLHDAEVLAAPEATGRWLRSQIRRGPFGRYALFLSVGEEPGASPLPNLGMDFELRVTQSAVWPGDTTAPGHGFFRSFAGERAARSTRIHPWVEHLFASERAFSALDHLLSECQDLLAQSDAGAIWVRRGPRPAPWFAAPEGKLWVGIGAFASFERADHALAERITAGYAGRMASLGGKRYLSGYFPVTSPAFWGEHYASRWDDVRHAKRAHDPAGLLNAGFLQFGPPALSHSSSQLDPSVDDCGRSSVGR